MHQFSVAHLPLSAAVGYADALPITDLVHTRPLPRRRRLSSTPWWRLLDGASWPWLQLTVDMAALAAAVAVAVAGAQRAGVDTGMTAVLWGFPVAAIGLVASRGLYSSRHWSSILRVVGSVATMLSISAMACVTAAALADGGEQAAPLVVRLWFFAVIYLCAGRTLLMLAQRWSRASRRNARRTLIVGAGVVGLRIAEYLDQRPDHGLEPVALLDATPLEAGRFGHLPILGSPEKIAETAASLQVQHVILAFSQVPDRELVPHVRRCEEAGIEVSFVPRLFESVTERVATKRLGALPLIGLRTVNPKGWQFALKYRLDRWIAAFMLIVMAPVMVLIAAGVKLTSSGPVFFRQRRVGLDGQVFDLLKFRSMRETKAPDVAFMPAPGLAPGGIEGPDRRTAFGKHIRRTFLDELPQLINVLRGEMSLVGPRPERPEFVALFGERIERYVDRHRVKSGITGWSQVNGLRGQTSLARRIEFDNYYIQNWSLKFDLKIVLLTIVAALSNREA